MAKKCFSSHIIFSGCKSRIPENWREAHALRPAHCTKSFLKKSYNICISSCQQNIKLDQFSQQNTHCRTAILQNSSLGAPNVWKAGLCATTGLQRTGLKWARLVGLINNFYIQISKNHFCSCYHGSHFSLKLKAGMIRLKDTDKQTC